MADKSKPSTLPSPPPPITHFHGEFEFLSNFAVAAVQLDGITYPTIEHAFQAAKTFSAEEREAIRLAGHPSEAKRIGRRVNLRTDWEDIKTDVMRGLLEQKFRQPEFKEKLLATGDAELIEGNQWGDRTWGCTWMNGRWIGQNRLGRLLMEIRTKLRTTEFAPLSSKGKR